MRVVSWNCRRATETSEVWPYLGELAPDVAFLQEVVRLPDTIRDEYQYEHRPARGRTGRTQRFGTALLVRGELLRERAPTSNKPWVNAELELFAGNVVSYDASVGGRSYWLLSIYSPAWHINSTRLDGTDVGDVRLPQQSEKMWLADLVWDALRNEPIAHDDHVIVAGDFNLSETFDTCWGSKPRGNAEYLRRLARLGFTDCLRHSRGELVPTFKDPRAGKIVHQIDHMFASPEALKSLRSCDVAEQQAIFGQSLSDHLPIIADFD